MAKLPLPTVRCYILSIELAFITPFLSSQCQLSQSPLFGNLCKIPAAIHYVGYLEVFSLQIVTQILILLSKRDLRFLNASVISTQATADAAVPMELAKILEVDGTQILCKSLIC